MGNGKKNDGIVHSPIVQAIALAELGTSGKIRVHLSKRLLERDPFFRASRLFSQFGMSRTPRHCAVLLYVNLRKRKFAFFGDQGIDKAVGNRFWKQLALELKENLGATHPERAIAISVLALGLALRKHFPVAEARS